MKNKFSFFLISSIVTLLITSAGSNLRAVGQTDDSGIIYQAGTYYCDEDFSYPTLVFRSDLGNIRLIEFQSEEFLPEWSPLQRCREIARRSLDFHDRGIISYLTQEVLPNGTKVICISKLNVNHLRLREIDKSFVRLLITLKSDDDPKKILDEIRGISSVSSSGEPLIH